MPETEVKIAVVDDEEIYRKRLINAFQRNSSFSVVHESSSAMGICETLQDCSPDVLLLDLSMPRVDGLQALQAVRSNPATAGQTVAILSMHGDAEFISEAIGQGKANAYITKDESPESIMTYARLLKEGKGPILSVSRGAENKNGERPDFRGIKGLTTGQLAVADMLDRGMKPKEIAAETGAAIATVYRHIHNIKDAIGFREYDGVLLFAAYLRHYLESCRIA
ncbi:MAG: response regulator transcription factor [bacterium]|nr:response regulator transcription factor [bacterium]